MRQNLNRDDELEVERLDGSRLFGKYLAGWERRRHDTERPDLLIVGTVGDSIGKKIIVPPEQVRQITILSKGREVPDDGF
jgi:hypothetical protein